MNAAKILHDTAMDFYDMAKIAKAKGNIDAHDEYMKKALVIEKEAALKLPQNTNGDFWPYAYLRSAAWMAFHLKQYNEARHLIQLALSGHPSPFELERLNEVIKAIEPFSNLDPNEKNDSSNILTGFLISIDIAQQKIVVQIGEDEYKNLVLPKQLHVAPFLLGHLVTVQVIQKDAETTIQEIRLAA